MFGQADAAEELLKHGANANKTWALGEPEDYDYEVASCLSIVMRVSQWDLAKSKKVRVNIIQRRAFNIHTNYFYPFRHFSTTFSE